MTDDKDAGPDFSELVAVLNLGFRQGANARAAAGFVLEMTSKAKPDPIPAPSAGQRDFPLSEAWQEGFIVEYQVGASDEELARVAEPGGSGLIREMTFSMWKVFGVLDKIQSNTDR